ncbi:MAG: hypothetical protein Q8M59_08525 [Tabrizicola sp.]|uniref:hypothetical protein n=1 Tax=Tabrizicola sp. TaxID=2005166 RepID=UPI00273718A5|nr:hypothetical protein [Tabrizicola sp.]MDP3262997.1 hypothetical protein [Tabrizicola sp.]MDP3649334.1 hypothetical protein [Paracoccaceae bacterium]
MQRLPATLLVILLLAQPSILMAKDGQIILYRGKGYEGLINPMIQPQAWLDGTLVGKCTKGEKITLSVAPGRHVLSTTSESPNDFAVTVGEGETVCVRCTIALGVIVPNFKLSRDDPAKCATVIKRMRPQGG